MNIATLSMGRPDFKSPVDRALLTQRSFDLAGTPYSMVVARPEAEPELWDKYLTGALNSYRKFGVERVLEYPTVAPGDTTTLFMPIVGTGGEVVGGVRAQGPYQSPDQAHALIEWGGRTGSENLRVQIASRIPAGVVEMKTGWVSDEIRCRHTLADAIARTPMHVMHLLDVRFALCTVADHAARRWSTTGAQVNTEIPAVAYPDERYRTVPIWWDRTTVATRMDEEHAVPLIAERIQLGEPYGLAGSRAHAA